MTMLLFGKHISNKLPWVCEPIVSGGSVVTGMAWEGKEVTAESLSIPLTP